MFLAISTFCHQWILYIYAQLLTKFQARTRSPFSRTDLLFRSTKYTERVRVSSHTLFCTKRRVQKGETEEAPPNEKKQPRRCGRCNQQGQNTRTCTTTRTKTKWTQAITKVYGKRKVYRNIKNRCFSKRSLAT